MTGTPSAGLDFVVDRADWSRHRFVESPAPRDLESGRVLFRVDRFAFTANNISYALSGDGLGYWRFFPAEAGMGRIPTMGFGDVVRSTHPEVAEGTRCFGFFPMSRYLEIQPGRASAGQIVDGAPHREGLAPAYNQYSPVSHDPIYAEEREDQIILLRGLFMTSFLAEDFLADNDYYGASSVLISSASSKTGIALGHQVSERGAAKAIGLTSPRNLDFVKNLGCYDQVVLYDEIESLPTRAPAVFVDMAGDGAVTRAIHMHFGDQLKHACNIGATHWEADRSAQDLPGPKPEFFFAPAQIQKRSQEWGPAVLQERLAADWSGFVQASDAWLQVVRGYGRAAVESVYEDTLAGRTEPSKGQVLSLWDSEAEASGR